MDELLLEALAGVGIGACMGLVGAGGAIFTVPLFGAGLGHDAKSAFIEALAVTGAVAAVGGAIAGVRGLVDWRRAMVFGVAGLAGAQIAAPVATRVDARAQVALFALVALVAAWRMWSAAGQGAGSEAAVDGGAAAGTSLAVPSARAAAGDGSGVVPPKRWKPVAVGAMIGALTSLIGVGGGFVLIPALAVIERLPMRTAVGTSMVVIAINAAAGIAGQALYAAGPAAPFDWRAVSIVAGCGMVSSVAGTGLQERVPQGVLRRAFAVALVAAAAWMVVRSS